MKAFLLLGGNVGNRFENLAAARELIARNIASLEKISFVYETAPWGNVDQPPFLNQVIMIETKLDPVALLHKIKTVEKVLGRQQIAKWGPRIIDIDILLIDDLIYESEELTIPHPQLHRRRFTLVPLADIAIRLRHPLLKLTIGELLESCEDKSNVRRLKFSPDSEHSQNFQ